MDNIIESLRKRYSDIPLLMFVRSVERSKGPGDLFDILETIPNQLPLIWDENVRRWVVKNEIVEYK